ncbi:hypothetical protein LSM04_002462 [Trypanosoma melophagium]|uniref:uncharacterized protein n=1 Tax=Trypanosoma melophagium TaxID=715481 RepID=UPI00351A88CF|nr:hypothetical protein LSM04_002462 [Trypanosoma melophagium]
MSSVALQFVNRETAADVFNTLRVLAPDGEAYLPPCLIMAAAREMGYYPTTEMLQRGVVEVIGRSGSRLNFPLFLQLCAQLESTKALEFDAVQRYKRAFDVHRSGVLSRSEFRTVLTTCASTDISSSEVEAIVELLDPTHSETIRLQVLETIMMQSLSKEAMLASEAYYYTPRSARMDPFRTMTTGKENVDHPLLLPLDGLDYDDVNEKKRLSLLANHRGNSNSNSNRRNSKNNNINNNSVLRLRNSPQASAPEEKSCSRGEPSPGLPPPRTTAPSPYTSGTVTRATSLQQCMTLPGTGALVVVGSNHNNNDIDNNAVAVVVSPPVASWDNGNQTSPVIASVVKPAVAASEKSGGTDQSPSQIPQTAKPTAGESTDERPQRTDDVPSIIPSSWVNGGSTRRGPSEPLAEEIKEMGEDMSPQPSSAEGAVYANEELAPVEKYQHRQSGGFSSFAADPVAANTGDANVDAGTTTDVDGIRVRKPIKEKVTGRNNCCQIC